MIKKKDHLVTKKTNPLSVKVAAGYIFIPYSFKLLNFIVHFVMCQNLSRVQFSVFYFIMSLTCLLHLELLLSSI